MKKIYKEKSISKTTETCILLHTDTGIFKGRKKQNAITLIALVLTIIIMLILSGVTLNLVFGEAGIIGRTEKTVDIAEIARVEDQANMTYSDLLIGGYASQWVYSEPTFNELLDNLKNENYIQNYGFSISSTVTGISIDKDSFYLAKGGKNFIHALLERTSEEGGDYYVEIDGKNFLVHKESDKIVIDKEPAEINELTVKSSNENVVTVSSDGLTITANASSSKTGNSTITVSYGDKSATCTVTVVDGSFSTAYGRIDVIWLDTANNIISFPNEPRLSGMPPITWAENEDYSATDTPTPATAQQKANKSWYSYNAGSGTADNRTSHWANAQNSDGSYFVWIPRYAYRITYYSSQTSTTPTGYYDGNGMYKADTNETLRYALDEGIKTVEYNNEKYIVHPAFETDLDNGGWDSELSGFWVAKYEMSRSDATTVKQGSSTIFKSVPSVGCAGNMGKIGNSYTCSLNYDRDKESHLIKNSEWGAVAYLTHSQFGRNGNEISVNQCGKSLFHVTGCGRGLNNDEDSEKTGTSQIYNNDYLFANINDIQKFNGKVGTLSSTTGNIYGVYDMSGGGEEYVAAWNTLSDHANISNGSSFASTGGASTKYATAYINGTSTDFGTQIYEVGKVGDASKERYVWFCYGWFTDWAKFCTVGSPFFYRDVHRKCLCQRCF